MIGQFIAKVLLVVILPLILHLLEEHQLRPTIIVIDGYVYLDGEAQEGLGKKLFDALEGRVVVVGVAKNRYKNLAGSYEICRGASKRPLFVTVEGMSLVEAKEAILSMHGESRMPSLLKYVDGLARGRH